MCRIDQKFSDCQNTFTQQLVMEKKISKDQNQVPINKLKNGPMDKNSLNGPKYLTKENNPLYEPNHLHNSDKKKASGTRSAQIDKNISNYGKQPTRYSKTCTIMDSSSSNTPKHETIKKDKKTPNKLGEHAIMDPKEVEIIESLPEKMRNEYDERFMRKAIELGEKGKATAPPNPWVGCVITDSHGNVIGEGFHAKAGTGHAEVMAIQNAIDRGNEDAITGATVYSTLEPCCHTGRTPPCTELLIKYKVGRVVIAVMDPDTKVNGAGAERLKANGIRVTTGIMEVQAAISLRSYIHHRRTGLPWVVLKIATSLDAKIAMADGTSMWITNEESIMDSHKKLRATSQAIVVGSKTAMKDNPSLTVRHLPEGTDLSKFTQPLRIVMGSTPPNLGSNLLDTKRAPTIFCTSKKTLIPDLFTSAGIEVISVSSKNTLDFGELLAKLGKRGVLQVLVEGGALLGSCVLNEGHVNQLVIYTAPIVMGNNAISWWQLPVFDELTKLPRWTLSSVRAIGDDICTEYIKKIEYNMDQ